MLIDQLSFVHEQSFVSPFDFSFISVPTTCADVLLCRLSFMFLCVFVFALFSAMLSTLSPDNDLDPVIDPDSDLDTTTLIEPGTKCNTATNNNQQLFQQLLHLR